MSEIDKQKVEEGRKGRDPSALFWRGLVYVFVFTPFITIMLALIAIEWGVAARVIKEGFNWGYDLLGF